MGQGIGCKIYEGCGRDCKCCEAEEEKQIERILKGYKKKLKSMTLAEINKDLENFSAERKARMAVIREKRATKE